MFFYKKIKQINMQKTINPHDVLMLHVFHPWSEKATHMFSS